MIYATSSAHTTLSMELTPATSCRVVLREGREWALRPGAPVQPTRSSCSTWPKAETTQRRDASRLATAALLQTTDTSSPAGKRLLVAKG